jgi:hypothetical protein
MWAQVRDIAQAHLDDKRGSAREARSLAAGGQQVLLRPDAPAVARPGDRVQRLGDPSLDRRGIGLRQYRRHDANRRDIGREPRGTSRAPAPPAIAGARGRTRCRPTGAARSRVRSPASPDQTAQCGALGRTTLREYSEVHRAHSPWRVPAHSPNSRSNSRDPPHEREASAVREAPGCSQPGCRRPMSAATPKMAKHDLKNEFHYTRTRDETSSQATSSPTWAIGTGAHLLRSHRDLLQVAPARTHHHCAMRYRKRQIAIIHIPPRGTTRTVVH